MIQHDERHARATDIRRAGALDFDALYRDARDDVYAYVVTLLRDRGAAEDVTAQAFERAFRKARRYDPGKGGAARLAVRHRPQRRARRAAARASASPRWPPSRPTPARRRPTTPPSARSSAPPCAPRSPACRRATARSSRSSSTPGLDNAELAAVLGVSVSNAGTQLHRAMTKLREAVDDRS